MEVEAVIFDWDGTLVDIDKRELSSINKALAVVGMSVLSLQEYIKMYYSRPYIEAGSRMLLRKLIVDEEAAKRAIEIYANEFSGSVNLTELQKDALETLQALKQKSVSLAVATLRRHRSVVEQEMQHLNIDRFIDALVTREDLDFELQRKSLFNVVGEVRGEQFVKALALLQKDVSRTIVVGDAWWDIRGARLAGIKSIWVKTGFGVYNDFGNEQPDMVLHRLKELLWHIEK